MMLYGSLKGIAAICFDWYVWIDIYIRLYVYLTLIITIYVFDIRLDFSKYNLICAIWLRTIGIIFKK